MIAAHLPASLVNWWIWAIAVAIVAIAAAAWVIGRSARSEESPRERRRRRRRQIDDRRDRVRFEPDNSDRRDGEERRDEDKNPFRQDRY